MDDIEKDVTEAYRNPQPASGGSSEKAPAQEYRDKFLTDMVERASKRGGDLGRALDDIWRNESRR